MEEFDQKLDRMTRLLLEYEKKKRRNENVPESLKEIVDEFLDWISSLSDEDYSRFIH